MLLRRRFLLTVPRDVERGFAGAAVLLKIRVHYPWKHQVRSLCGFQQATACILYAQKSRLKPVLQQKHIKNNIYKYEGGLICYSKYDNGDYECSIKT
jgi:hypothetical protein